MRLRISFENFLYLFALLLALALRLVDLTAPLSDFEAGWAMQAFDLSVNPNAFIAGQPAYVVLTGFLFNLFGSSEALARFLPVLVGASLVALPYLFRQRLGRIPSVLLAFALAMDPGLVAISRTPGSPVLALGFGLWGLAAWVLGLPIPAGILFALALLSGPAAITGLVILLATLFLLRLFLPFGDEKPDFSLRLPAASLGTALIAAAATLLLIGTFFFRYPQGLSALAAAIPDYFAGWAEPSGVPFIYLLLALAVYQPLAVVFGYIGLLRAWVQDQPLGKALSLWLAVSFALALAYPARQVFDLAWMLVPLGALAALEIARYFEWQPEDGWAPWGHALLVLALSVFFALNLAALPNLTPDSIEYQTRLNVVAGAIVLIGAASLLVGFGWSSRAAIHGLVWGGASFLALVVLSATWGLTRPGPRLANELWFPGPAAGQVAIFENTLGDLSEWESGHRAGSQVVYRVEWPSVRWALRLRPEAQYAVALSPDSAPPIIVSDELSGEPALASPYRGQSFAWRVYPSWNGALPSNLLKWWLYRDGLTFSEKVVLWGRSDVFPEDIAAGLGNSADVAPPAEQDFTLPEAVP